MGSDDENTGKEARTRRLVWLDFLVIFISKLNSVHFLVNVLRFNGKYFHNMKAFPGNLWNQNIVFLGFLSLIKDADIAVAFLVY